MAGVAGVPHEQAGEDLQAAQVPAVGEAGPVKRTRETFTS